MGGRAVDCSSLENCRGCKSSGGSNPSPSAIKSNILFCLSGHDKCVGIKLEFGMRFLLIYNIVLPMNILSGKSNNLINI